MASRPIIYVFDGDRRAAADDLPSFPLGVLSVSDGEVRTGLIATSQVRTTIGTADASTTMALPRQQCGDECGSLELTFERESGSFRRT